MTREAELLDLILRLSWRIMAAHDVLANLAEKRSKPAEFVHPCG